MQGIVHLKVADVEQKHISKHKDYEYLRKELVVKGTAKCAVSLYEIPPEKAAYPYHYHVESEEAFYIMSGKGLLSTPEGVREVQGGDFLFFPANETGAHKLTNASKTDSLVYLDFGTTSNLDMCFYPDSGKLGILHKGVNKFYKEEQSVDYYEGE